MTGILLGGLDVCSAAIAGSYDENHWIAVGTSGAAYASGNTALASEFGRQQVDTNDLTTQYQVTSTANWSPSEISGCVLKEFGLTTTGSKFASRNLLTGSLVFDGEQELQLQQTLTFFM